jgi:hypothetical protein
MSSDIHPLRKLGFEWHDLCVSSIEIGQETLTIVLAPFNEEKQAYDSVSFVLSSYQSLCFDINGEFSSSQLQGLEISSLILTKSSEDLISGALYFIPFSPSSGCWKISFSNANWKTTSHLE